MELSVAINLIDRGVVRSGAPQLWADLGAGNGLFTRALLSLLPPSSLIHAVDQNVDALSGLRMEKTTQVKTHVLNFEKNELPFSELDGVLLANALHFVADKNTFLRKVKAHLKTNGTLLLIEYDLSSPNPWVPFPIPFANLPALMKDAGFGPVRKLAEVPSRYNTSMIYSCVIEI